MAVDTLAIDREQRGVAASELATDAERAFEALRHDIVRGSLKPDVKLKIRELKSLYGFGGSPLREALAQLSAQGLVAQSSQRGFRVPPLTAEHLDDITRSRQLIECEALRLAMQTGGVDWEARIVAEFHRLEREVERLMKQRRALGVEFERIHHRFHRALVAACPLQSLTSFAELLYTQGARYRLIMQSRIAASPEAIAEHRRLMDLTLARKPAAITALAAHIALPAKLLITSLQPTGEPISPTPANTTRATTIKRRKHA